MSESAYESISIILRGNIHPELTSIGLKPGDKKKGLILQNSQTGSVYFDHNGQQCVVYLDNYRVDRSKKL